jgi:hypothetical protein
MRGNHDERIYDFRNNCTGMVRDYATDGIKQLEATIKRCKAKMLPYDSDLGVLELGSLRIVHGYHAGKAAIREHASVYGRVLFGHVHTQERYQPASLDNAESISIGCLCQRDMDYVNKKTGKLRWANGWAFGLLFPSGEIRVELVKKDKEGFTCATDFKTY